MKEFLLVLLGIAGIVWIPVMLVIAQLIWPDPKDFEAFCLKVLGRRPTPKD